MPCVAELPYLVQVADEFAAQGGRVIGISQDLFIPKVDAAAALAAVQKKVAALDVPYPMFVLDDKTLDPLNARFDLPGPIPCTIALDANGKEVDREEGDADLDRFRAMMRKALGQ
jgi:hypothetical protein